MTEQAFPTNLDVAEALKRVLARCAPMPSEEVALSDICGRALAIDITAPWALPHVASAAIDGYAVQFNDVAHCSAHKPAVLRCIGEVTAGRAFAEKVEPGNAVRIMSGAALPADTDTVIPLDATDASSNGTLKVQIPPDERGHAVYKVGDDVGGGELVLSRGALLRPQDISILAALGLPRVAVARRPRVVVLATGNELLAVDAPMEPGKVRNTNDLMLAALVEHYGGIATCLPPAGDDAAAVAQRLTDVVEQHTPDMVLTSAGVSDGTYDVVRQALEAVGTIDFWKVNMTPGRPLLAGSIGGVPMVGLPGKPVSAFTCAEVFVRPMLLRLQGRPDRPHQVRALLDHDVRTDEHTMYLPARFYPGERCYRVTTRSNVERGSHALSKLVWANGLLLVKPQCCYRQGDSATVIALSGWQR